MRFLQPEREVKLMNYLTNSLFDPGGPDNQGVKWEYAWSHDGHLEKFTEESMTKRWGALSMDYVYTMDQHKPPSRELKKLGLLSLHPLCVGGDLLFC